jgi:hypothetical protein
MASPRQKHGHQNVADAFISHASKDANTANQLAASQEAEGFNVWFDDSAIRLGVLLGKELIAAIHSSRVFVLLWSKNAAKSRWSTQSGWRLFTKTGLSCHAPWTGAACHSACETPCAWTCASAGRRRCMPP